MATLLEYKCPCCGGAIEFDSSLQKMKCPYCDTEFDVETLKSLDEDLGDNDDTEWEAQPGGEAEAEHVLLMFHFISLLFDHLVFCAYDYTSDP